MFLFLLIDFMILKICFISCGVRFMEGLFKRIVLGWFIKVWFSVSICCLLFEV